MELIKYHFYFNNAEWNFAAYKMNPATSFTNDGRVSYFDQAGQVDCAKLGDVFEDRDGGLNVFLEGMDVQRATAMAMGFLRAKQADLMKRLHELTVQVDPLNDKLKRFPANWP
jgi:hypothetical protein